ncbi:MAG: DegV family protein [Thermodesulfobacteriota bacterium]
MPNRMLMIDTGCAPTREIVAKYNLDVMSIKIVLDGEEYWDWNTLDTDTYYGMIDRIEEFHTQPPSLWDVFDRYEEIRDKGYDELIDIHLSAKMSDTVKICDRARQMVKGLDVTVIDTGSVSAGAYFIADKILSLLNSGRNSRHVMELLPEIRKSTYIQFSVPTVKYLVKNGRVGRAQAFAALVLNIKPILGVENGEVIPISKEQGIDRVVSRMAENAYKFLKKRPHHTKIYFMYGFDSTKQYMEMIRTAFMEKLKDLNIKDIETVYGRAMPTVACHSGPEVFGIAVYGEQKPIE